MKLQNIFLEFYQKVSWKIIRLTTTNSVLENRVACFQTSSWDCILIIFSSLTDCTVSLTDQGGFLNFVNMAPGSPHSYFIAALLLLCHKPCQLDAQHCKSEYSINGMMLKDHVFKEKMTADVLKCVEWCNTDVRCQSINYVVSQYICELNERTREARPHDFISDVDRLYATRVWQRGIF